MLVAAFSLLLVFGALLTALAETGFTAQSPAEPSQTIIQVGSKASATTAVLPSSTPQPEPEQPEPSATPEVQEVSDPAGSATSTPTATATATGTAATSPTACTIPDGWGTYKIRSGDTLFSISKLYQTTVPILQIGNCMGGSSRIITGKTLWVPNNPTLTPSKTSGPTPTDKPAPTDAPTKTTAPTCYLLTLNHTGSGANPAASPTNSTGCPAGKYTAGQAISLTASPADGFEVSGWTGTADDASTSTSNSLTMPASAKTVSVAYSVVAPTCYTLTLGIAGASTGTGGTPTASASTAGCATGEYASGETITMTAYPDSGFLAIDWTFTNDNTSASLTVNTTANPNAVTITMPAAPATILVTYGAP